MSLTPAMAREAALTALCGAAVTGTPARVRLIPTVGQAIRVEFVQDREIVRLRAEVAAAKRELETTKLTYVATDYDPFTDETPEEDAAYIAAAMRLEKASHALRAAHRRLSVGAAA